VSFFFVDPEVYKQYREAVLTLSDSVQINFQEHLPPETRKRGLSDREIGEKLSLDERTVREIRVVAERDTYDLSEWEKAIEFKDKACRAFARHGISYVFKYRNEIK
jgi:hypothetical protein